MNFWLVGLSHKTAPVEVRERLAIDNEGLPAALRAAAALPDISEAFILSTCNRVEIFTRSETDHERVGDSLAEFLARYHHWEPSELEPYLYQYWQRDAIRHMFRVASSLPINSVAPSRLN